MIAQKPLSKLLILRVVTIERRMSAIQALLLRCYCLLVVLLLLACSANEAAVISTRSLEDNLTAMQSPQSEHSTTAAQPPASSMSYDDPTSSESSTTTTPLPDPDQCPQTNLTSTTNDTVLLQHLKQLRLASIRAQILAKFGLSDPPDTPDTNPMDEETMATYYQFLSASGSGGEGKGEECGAVRGEKSTFYAKELRLHFPSSFRAIIPSIETFEWPGSLYKPDRRRRYAKGDDDFGKPPEKENSKDGGPSGGSSEGPVSPSSEETPTTPPETTTNRFSDAQAKVLQGYVAPLVYKLSFNDLDRTQTTTSALSSAELRLFKRKKVVDDPQIKRDVNPIEKVEVFRVWNSTSRDGLEYRFITSQNIDTERDEYVAFNVTNAIKDWLGARNQSDFVSFEVLVRAPQSVTSGLSFLPSIEFDVPGYGKGQYNAQLVLAMPSVEDNLEAQNQESNQQQGSGSSNRRKRQSEEGIDSEYCRDNPNETNCCLRDLIIDFHKDLNMTWVLTPRTYQVNYCEGLCPSYWPMATQSTKFLNSYRESNPLSAPEPCCTAASTSPLTMVVVINNRIYFNHVPNMIVNSCICR